MRTTPGFVVNKHTSHWVLDASSDGWARAELEPTDSLDDPGKEDSDDDDHDDSDDKYKSHRTLLFSLLFVASSMSGALSFTIDLMISSFDKLRVHSGITGDDHASFLKEVAFDTLLLCGARYMTYLVPSATGSGLPEVKCMLSNTKPMLSEFLQWKVVPAKALGLAFAVGAGLPLGKEGPFVHIAVVVGMQVLSAIIQFFGGLKKQKTRTDVILAAVSVGVGCTFSAPVGGVLFALELMMPHLYDRVSYFDCFFSSCIASLCYLLLKMLYADSGITPLITANVHHPKRGFWEELIFLGALLILGAFCGLLGGLFVKLHRGTTAFVKKMRGLGSPPCPQSGSLPEPLLQRKRFLGPSLIRDFMMLALMATISAAAKLYGGTNLLVKGPAGVISSLFDKDVELDMKELLFVLVFKVFFTTVALCMPVPSGCVGPLLVVGGLLGRIGCKLLVPIGDFSQGGFADFEAQFAVVGACCFVGCVLRTYLSTAVSVFELTAIPFIILPLSLASLVATLVQEQLDLSLIDSIILMKKIPALPTLNASSAGMRPMKDVVKKDSLKFALPRRPSASQIESVRKEIEQADVNDTPELLPVCDVVCIKGTDTTKLHCTGTVPSSFVTQIIQEMNANGSIDVLEFAIRKQALQNTFEVDVNSTIRDSYLQAQTSDFHGTYIVTQRGCLYGIMTQSQIIDVSIRAMKSVSAVEQ